MFSSDFEKAFDSIDHCFMFACVKKFGFGTQFVQWVKTLFKNAQSCVMNNGFSTGYFALERGTRQGDPLSAYLFILAIEVLLIRVRDSELVRGIPVIDKEIKLDAYADDGRFFLKDLQSLYTILDIMEEFGTFSSLELNLQKSEACWIGASRFNTNTSTNCIWVNLVNDKIRILGIYISYNKQLAYQYNFVNVTTDTKNILSIWRLRGLSLAGRIQVFKALALSKAMFICTMKPYSIDTSTRIFQYKILNNILYLNNRLYKMTITEGPLCSLCGDDLETILHFFCHCSITQKLWTQMQNWPSNILDIPELTSKIVILGKCPCQGATDILINHIILMFKKFLYTHRKSTTQVSFVALKPYIAKTQKIEQTIARKNGKLTLHFKKWSPIIELL